MRYRKYTILQYITSIGAIIVVISDWGSPAALATLGIVILVNGVALMRYCKKQRERPFISSYSCDDPVIKSYTDDEIDNQTKLPKQEWPSTKQKLILDCNSKHSIHVDLRPRVSQELGMVDVRFVPDINQPSVIFFQDLTPPARLHNKPSHRRPVIKGIALNYDPPMTIVKDGKALDYLINIETYSAWKGVLSLQFSFVHMGVRFVRIHVEVT